MDARSAITIRTTPANAYARWHDFASLSTFMAHVRSVLGAGERRWHWVVEAPAGSTVEWDAEVTDDVPGTVIAWRSVPGADVASEGSVRFVAAPGDQGTEVHVALDYAPPAGALGAAVAKLFGEEPNQQLADDLRRFKQLVETGEIARSDGSPRGTRTADLVHQDAARPAGATV
jgi:uncharacterized membrane protein